MVSSVILAGVMALSSPKMDFPKVWEKIDGQWAYVGKVKEKPQVLFWSRDQAHNLLAPLPVELVQMPLVAAYFEQSQKSLK